ncbi:MAG: hypothetical protein KAR51_00295 [Candidatus Aenigmarchaeota archaeon]|nr:hypothetical protein [Candidatus Aenigmarchaeota archaeon]
MGFLDKIKESVGLDSKKGINVPTLDKDLDLLSTQQAAQENTMQPEMETQKAPATDIPPNTENIPQNDIEGIAPLSPESIQNPPSQPSDIQPEIKDADIQTPEESINEQNIQDTVQDAVPTKDIDIQDTVRDTVPANEPDTQDNIQNTVPISTPLDNNTAENFENIRQEKMKISGELERLTTEIDGIIKNLENELKDGKTINKTEAKPEKIIKEDKKISDVPKKEKEIKKADNKADNTTSAKQSKGSKKITEKDIEALEDFLSKENIKDMPKSK